MQYRTLGKTGFSVSSVSFGAWALGGDFGTVQDDSSLNALRRAVEMGVNFFDTADVYGDGRSERLLGELKKEFPEIIIATKAGRRLTPHTAAGYNLENLTQFVDRSLKNLGVDSLDLVQLHCPPTDTYYRPSTFEALDRLQESGKLKHYGVSVERVEEALKAIEYPGVKTVQIIYNIFRQRPADLFLPLAKERGIGVLARLPLSSGLLAGKITARTQFEDTDHRKYNLHGEAFDRGETFSGIDLELTLPVVEKLRSLLPPDTSMAQFALRWILMNQGVTCAIPGAKTASQVEDNAAAADLPPLPERTLQDVLSLYESSGVKAAGHQLW